MGSAITVPLTVVVGLLSAKPSDVKTKLKWLISFICIKIYEWTTKKRFDLYNVELDNEPEKTGFIPPQEEHTLESPCSESHLQKGSDEVFCYGVNSAFECLVVRVARACNQEAEAWIYLKLNNGKSYQLQKTSSYQQSCCHKKVFSCGGLQMHYITPMRNWRIFYNGWLKETSDDHPESDRMVHVKFAFLWRASSDSFDFKSDVNKFALATSLARTEWKTLWPPLKNLYNALDFYAQAGIIHGTVSIDETPDQVLYLFGERIRFLGDLFEKQSAEFCHVLGQISKNGTIVHLSKISVPNIVKNFTFGFVVFPKGKIEIITDLDAILETQFNEANDEEMKAVFHADGLPFKLSGFLVENQYHLQNPSGWEGNITIDSLVIELNSLFGNGVAINGRILKPLQKKHSTVCSTIRVPLATPYVVHFSDKLSQIPEIAGGKGSSLGKLTQLSKDFKNFIVPNGIVVTTSAYEAFLTKCILEEVSQLEEVLYGKTEGDVKKACQRVMDEVYKTKVPDEVILEILKGLQKIYGEKVQAQKFAIRSSATGEDTEQMSAAGQMETFLGVTNLSEILSSVRKCWASQFSYITVQYKRQNGQIINSPMAVVIQEMVPCDVAGVLFTCDPLTGNPTLMSITANYGLGESVVSGSEEPDTVELQRDFEDNLIVKNKVIGAKQRRIFMDDSKGTRIEDISEKDRQICCLSDDMILRLGNLGVNIEKSYRSHRDIEWGFWNGDLYIFQSRPVTSGTGETDFEIDHEKDGPMRTENEYFTMYNVGEVMPGAMSPLGSDVSFRTFTIAFQRKTLIRWQGNFRPMYFPKGITSILHHSMFYVADLFQDFDGARSTSDATMLSAFGRIIDDDELFETIMDRYGRSKRDCALLRLYRLLKSLYIPEGRLQKFQRNKVDNKIQLEKYKTSQELFAYLLTRCTDGFEAIYVHMLCTTASSVWNTLVLHVIGNARGGINADTFRDFAQLLAAISDVESADVPSAMQSLAFNIAKDIDPETFKKMKVEEATNWLMTTDSPSGKQFRQFLEKHGHRCLRESELRVPTWSSNPKPLVQILQNLAGSIREDKITKKNDDIDKLILEIGIPLGFIQRLMLKFLLPRARSGVQHREASKSLVIKGYELGRKGYWHLAKLMVQEGRIPDEDILFFMTLTEIQELLATRSPKIISRANHRRRRYPELDSYIFPEIMSGFPIPVNISSTPIEENGDNFIMTGMPVSQGIAKGFVRVAITLDEAAHLQPGEILVTYSTDIGWTPYFPALAGVVTEIGGLISHGAVVSREYGLPCIAGIQGATRHFKTGDYVLLDGNKGVLQKLPHP